MTAALAMGSATDGFQEYPAIVAMAMDTDMARLT